MVSADACAACSPRSIQEAGSTVQHFDERAQRARSTARKPAFRGTSAASKETREFVNKVLQSAKQHLDRCVSAFGTVPVLSLLERGCAEELEAAANAACLAACAATGCNFELRTDVDLET